jgi:hypothetical protein
MVVFQDVGGVPSPRTWRRDLKFEILGALRPHCGDFPMSGETRWGREPQQLFFAANVWLADKDN